MFCCFRLHYFILRHLTLELSCSGLWSVGTSEVHRPVADRLDYWGLDYLGLDRMAEVHCPVAVHLDCSVLANTWHRTASVVPEQWQRCFRRHHRRHNCNYRCHCHCHCRTSNNSHHCRFPRNCRTSRSSSDWWNHPIRHHWHIHICRAQLRRHDRWSSRRRNRLPDQAT